MNAVTISPNANHVAAKHLKGFSIRESAGTPAAAAVNLRDSAVGGQIIAVIELAANASTTTLFQDTLSVNGTGVYVQVVSGTVEGVLYAA